MARFYGWRVVGAAFVLAFFGWGLGFYGPPVYLHAVREARGFSLGVVSAAVTVHFLAGALVVANVPALYRRFGLPAVTIAARDPACPPASSAGRSRAAPWQLFAATLVSGAGWAAMGGVAVNAVVSPWFVRARPVALGTRLQRRELRRADLLAAVGVRDRPDGAFRPRPRSIGVATVVDRRCARGALLRAHAGRDGACARRRHARRAGRCR